jgi:predicted flavoprotein YhiN
MAWRYIKMNINTTDEDLQKSFQFFVEKISPFTAPYDHHFNTKLIESPFLKDLDKETYLNPSAFATCLKKALVPIVGLRSVEEAISTVGGISMDEVDVQFRLIKHPHISIVGEMLDWDAPTGGFLLQGCFSTGFKVGQFLNQSLR